MSTFSFAQTSFCGTPSPPDYLQNIPLGQMKAASTNNTLRIAAHIIRKDDGTGGLTCEEVQDAITIMYNDFAPHGIRFELIVIDEIHNSVNYNSNKHDYADDSNGDGKFDNFSTNGSFDVIDIYFFPSNTGFGGGKSAYIPGTSLVIGGFIYGVNMGVSSILSHEMGHLLGLYHTFLGTCGGGCPELVDGSNCNSCGDFVCDTPADHQTFQVDPATCLWNGNFVVHTVMQIVMSMLTEIPTTLPPI